MAVITSGGLLKSLVHKETKRYLMQCSDIRMYNNIIKR